MAKDREGNQNQLTLQSVWDSLQALQNQVNTQAASLNNQAVALTGVVNGPLSSPNFVSGISGWQLLPNGDFEGNSGTFRGSLTGNTITGALIETATSGERIRITSASATTPTQSANSIAFIDASNNILAFIGIGYELGSILTIVPATDVNGAYFYAPSGVALSSNNLVNIYMAEATSSSNALSIQNIGTGVGLYIFSTGTGIGLSVNDNAVTSSADLVYINSINTSSNALHIVKNNTGGYGFYLQHESITTAFQAAYIVNAGASIGLYIVQTNSSSASYGLYITQARANEAVASFQGTVTSSHFYKIWIAQTVTFYCSDGTTPNGNLGANEGDICYGGDSGKPYWNNNGGTGWTAF